jgi:hypothetical protein
MPVKLYYDLETKACGSFEAWWNETELGEYEGMGLSWAPKSPFRFDLTGFFIA